MAVTVLSGDLATDIINAVQRKPDVDDVIAELEPNNAPYMAILRKLKKKAAINPQIQWLENENMPRFDTMSASATSAATALGVTNPSYFRVGDGVRITETGEFIQITGVSASAIGANRGIGGVVVSGASCTSAAGLYIVNNANAEGASLRTIKSVKLVNQSNFCQIIREPFGVTETERASSLYGTSDDLDRKMKDAGMKHERELEFTSLFGAKKEDLTTSGAPVRFAGGMFEYISTNTYNAAGTLTRANFESLFLRPAFRYGSDRKLLLASPLVMQAIDGFAWNASATSSQVQVPQPVRELNVAVKTYVCSQGIVDIVMVRHWNDDATLKGYAFLVDLDAVWYRPLRDTHTKMNVQAPDADKVEGEWKSEVSFEIQHERRHGLIKGVTG